MSNKKKGLVPKLRFPEFKESGEWELLPLEAKADLLSGFPFKSAEISEDPKGIPILRGINITEGYIRHSFDMDRYFLGDVNVLKKYQLQVDDLVIGMDGSKVGKNSALISEKDSGSLLIQRVARLRANCKATMQFIFQHVHSSKFHSYVDRINTSGGIPHISAKQINEFEIYFPPVERELQKIADCLSSLDALISAQADKVDTLKTHKKALMQQLFPREGETVPRLRFPKFKNGGRWKVKSLGDIGNVLMCKRIFADQTNEHKGVPFFKIGTLGRKPDAFISKELFEEYRIKYNYPRKGEVLITCSGTVGKCLRFDGSDAYFQDSNIVWVDNPTLEISNDFLHLLLLNVDWGRLNSTTITRIYGPDLRNLSLVYPEASDEQKAVADCLLSLDELIAAETDKLDALKTHKKGLMQQLFPVLDEAAV